MDGNAVAKTNLRNAVGEITFEGALLTKNAESGNKRTRIIVDRFDVLLANPCAGDKYSPGHYHYWAVCYGIGFDKNGSRSVHTFKMEMVRESDTGISFNDQHGNKFVLEPIGDDDESAAAIFKKWLAYKQKKADIWEELYDDYAREALEMIRYWESNI